MTLSLTRQSFQAALAEAQEYFLENAQQYPAFLNSVDSLPRLKRRALRSLSPQRVKPAMGSNGLTLAGAAQQLAEGSLSVIELAHQTLAAIAQRNEALNAFVYALPPDQLLAEAEQLEQERRQGKLRGLLHGLPISVKDVIAVKGMPNTASSQVLAGAIAADDAAAVRLLRQAGALITGKTHTHEFALGVTTPQSRNPWDAARDPGGSSGGSAISVATGMSLASLGTDTRASIRVPAALCSVVGYKPTFGLVPTQGVTTLSWSLDHVAPLAHTAADIALLLNVLAVNGKRRTNYTRYLNKDVRGLRVGLAVNGLTDADPDVLAAFQNSVAALRVLGVEVVETDQPTAQEFNLAVSMGLILSRCEAVSYHQAFNFREKEALYTRPVFEQLDEASRVTAETYLRTQRYRAAFRCRMLAHLEQFDALLMPTSRVPAPKSDEVEKFFLVLSLNCIPWSFIGFPAISLPCGRTPAGLPVGAQLVAGPLEDGRLLALAAALESALV